MTTFTPEQQIETLVKVLNSGYIKSTDLAIDGGANHGDWAVMMSEVFKKVMAFEPAYDTFKTLLYEMKRYPNIECINRALLDRACQVEVVEPPKKKSDRSRYVKVGGQAAQGLALPIDSFNLSSCGLIKLDIEGAEFMALLGAKKTIARCKPVLIVELNGLGQKRYNHSDSQTLGLIKSMGYKMVMDCPPDKVFVHKEVL